MLTVHIWLPAGISLVDSLLAIMAAMAAALIARFVIGFATG